MDNSTKTILIVVTAGVISIATAMFLVSTDQPEPARFADPHAGMGMSQESLRDRMPPGGQGMPGSMPGAMQGSMPGANSMGNSDESAKIQLDKMLASAPNDVQLRIDSGNIYYDRGQFEDAARMYEQAVLLDPTNANVLTDLGTCYRRMGKTEKALEFFKKAMVQDYQHAISRLNAAIVLDYDLHNSPEAIKYYKEYLTLDSDPDRVANTRKRVEELESGQAQ